MCRRVPCRAEGRRAASVHSAVSGLRRCLRRDSNPRHPQNRLGRRRRPQDARRVHHGLPPLRGRMSTAREPSRALPNLRRRVPNVRSDLPTGFAEYVRVHASRRARQGRGRHQTRRRVRRQCGDGGGARGSLIPHAGAVRALMVTMIEAPFGTTPMTLTSCAHRVSARGLATRRRAIGVAAIARRTNGEDAIAASTDFLAKRPVHDGDAAARFDWTRRTNRGTREMTGSVRRSIEAVIGGLEGSAPGPHLNLAAAPQRSSNPRKNGYSDFRRLEPIRERLRRVGPSDQAPKRAHRALGAVRLRLALSCGPRIRAPTTHWAAPGDV
jgi:hypothetical protein